MAATSPISARSTRRYAGIVLALTVALMMSDYTTRSVINAILPDLKAQWTLSDSQLGMLVSIVPLVVGIGAWPVALLADRIGYVRSITAMAAVWGVATVLCGLSQSHTQMLLARAAVGLGEAGYGAVGAALLSSVFPAHRLSTVLGTFQFAAVLGSALGVVAGGMIAAAHGWPLAFVSIGVASLLLVVAYPLVVREPQRAPAAERRSLSLRDTVRAVLSARSACFVYVGSGMQALVLAVLAAWIPTFLTREYGLTSDQAGVRGGLLILLVGVGMVAGGAVADRWARDDGARKLRLASAYAALAFVLLATGLNSPAGTAQLALISAGVLLAGGHAGITSAAIVGVTPVEVRATAIATIALANNLLGLAPGPYLVGVLSDTTSLKTALALFSVAGAIAAGCFLLASRSFQRDADRLRAGSAAPVA